MAKQPAAREVLQLGAREVKLKLVWLEAKVKLPDVEAKLPALRAAQEPAIRHLDFSPPLPFISLTLNRLQGPSLKAHQP